MHLLLQGQCTFFSINPKSTVQREKTHLVTFTFRQNLVLKHVVNKIENIKEHSQRNRFKT